MDNNKRNVKLTEKDKKTISKNSDICTDSHGKGCSTEVHKENNRNLN